MGYKLKKTIELKALCRALSLEFFGINILIKEICSLNELKENCLTFSNKANLILLNNYAVIMPEISDKKN